MKVTINNSVSLDGFICGPNGEEDWISEADTQYFEKACEAADIIVLGSGTFDANTGLYPIPGKENIVFTKDLAAHESLKGITYTDEDPISYLRKHQGAHVLVAGGGKLNATILKAGLATDIVVCIHPIILGAGTRQFSDIDYTAVTKLTKLSEADIGDGVVKIHYQVQN